MIGNRKKRINARGSSGEDIAVKYLQTHGYRVLDRNFTTSVGEVDIFVTDESTLIAVEVKSRLSLEYGTPVRFDVVEVYIADKTVNHIKNAFDSYLRY